MKVYAVKLQSTSPYSQGKHYDKDMVPELEKEGKHDYEMRTWRNRMHVDEQGQVFIPPMAFKNCLSEAAKFLGIQIPGKGKSTYTKHFEAGVLVLERISLGIAANDVPGEMLFVPTDGVRGSGKRVNRMFPRIDRWNAEFRVHVIDETITEVVLRKHFEEAGNLIGIGRFRPRNNGYYGRFQLVKIAAVAA